MEVPRRSRGSRVTGLCCGMLLIVALFFLAFAFGYFFREHQPAQIAAQWTHVEEDVIHNLQAKADPLEDWWHGPFRRWMFSQLSQDTCEDGVLLPGPARTHANALIYLALLLWAFVGVALAADVFMEAIEKITSAEVKREIRIGGTMRVVTVSVWNGSVANLTLMALGSSAPEILLSCIEIGASGFYAGELGPSTIVGSAAFNMLVISAVCVAAIPKGEGRSIKELPVFGITGTFSVLAYVWLIVILNVISPNVVEVWEGATTLLFFPLLVLLAYLADIHIFTTGCCTRGLHRQAKGNRRYIAITDGDGVPMNPEEKHSRAWYRSHAIRSATGGAHTAAALQLTDEAPLESDGRSVIMLREASKSVFLEDELVEIGVSRTGDLSAAAAVQYIVTDRPSGLPKGAVLTQSGTIEFGRGQSGAFLQIEMLESDKAKSSGHAFTVELRYPSRHAVVGQTRSCAISLMHRHSPTALAIPNSLRVKESDSVATVKVRREGNTSGAVTCHVETRDGSAVAPYDYSPIDAEVEFAAGEREKIVTVTITNDGRYERNEYFMLVFGNASGAAFSYDCDGGPERAVCTVMIESDEEIRHFGDSLAAFFCINIDAWRATGEAWRTQFVDAVAYDGDGLLGLFLYLASLPWKLVLAFLPPPRLGGGSVCFFFSLVAIGVLTAFIGDIASHMGCCLGISKSITAITFVALGTSLPDTFASKIAAETEPHADASLGNVTGSNAVNVFLGLGLPWAFAAVYWSYFATTQEAEWRARYSGEPWYTTDMPVGFVVPAADLGFSVAVFSACAVICLATLALRRLCLGYELGKAYVLPTVILFGFLWLVYIGASIAYSYHLEVNLGQLTHWTG